MEPHRILLQRDGTAGCPFTLGLSLLDADGASIAILLLAVELFEFSANITVDTFLDLTKDLMQPASKSPSREFHATHFLVEVKARYVWLTTVVVALVAGAYAAMMCATLIYQSHPMRRLMVVSTVGLVLSAIGLLFLW